MDTIAKQLQANFSYNEALVIAHVAAEKIITGQKDHFLFIFPDNSFLKFSRLEPVFGEVIKEPEEKPEFEKIQITPDFHVEIAFFDKNQNKPLSEIMKARPYPLKIRLFDSLIQSVVSLFIKESTV